MKPSQCAEWIEIDYYYSPIFHFYATKITPAMAKKPFIEKDAIFFLLFLWFFIIMNFVQLNCFYFCCDVMVCFFNKNTTVCMCEDDE